MKKENIFPNNKNKIYEFNENLELFRSTINSYLWIMKHNKTKKLREKMLKRLDLNWWKFFNISEFSERVIKKYQYNNIDKNKYKK